MRKTNNGVWLCLTALALSLGCAGSLAVPKAAEDEDAPVSYGEATAPPKPTSKAAAKAAPPPAKKAVERPQAGQKRGRGSAQSVETPVTGQGRPAPKKPPEQAARSTRKK
jgi:hypothetical protein